MFLQLSAKVSANRMLMIQPNLSTIYACGNLLAPYTDMVVVVKFGWQGVPPRANNFVLTAYLVERW